MGCLFDNCEKFNQPLNSWNVSNVAYMSDMFYGCENFNQPLNSWDIDNSTNTGSMFYKCGIDEKNLPNFTKLQKKEIKIDDEIPF